MVISPWISNESQRVHFLPGNSLTGAAMGSEKANNGNAKFTKPFLYDSIFLWPEAQEVFKSDSPNSVVKEMPQNH